MEHNTLVKYGFLQADILSVLYPEGDTAENFPQGKPHYICDDDDDGNPIPKKVTKKHSLDSPNPVKNERYPATQHTPSTTKKVVKKVLNTQTTSKKKKKKPSIQVDVQVSNPLPSQPCSGIIWSNNSCGYDAVFIILYFIWQSGSEMV